MILKYKSIIVFSLILGIIVSQFLVLSAPTYGESLPSNSNPVPKTAKPITITTDDYDISSTGDTRFFPSEYEGRKVILWENQSGDVTFRFNVPESGSYTLSLDYFPLISEFSSDNMFFELLIDGERPFKEAESIIIPRLWKNETGILKDWQDNDILPLQIGISEWSTAVLKDKLNRPYYFRLEKGSHTITLRGDAISAAISGLSLETEHLPSAYTAPDETKIYATPPIVIENEFNDKTILIEGETPFSKNSQLLYGTSDNLSFHINPSHPIKHRINTIGKGNWTKNGQALTYDFAVSKSGYYRFTLKVKQDNRYGLTSYRSVYIDGSVPYFEFKSQAFPYNDNWYKKTLSGYGGEEIWLFLDEGHHKLTLEATPGNREEMITRAEYLLEELKNGSDLIPSEIASDIENIKALTDALSPYGSNNSAPQMLINALNREYPTNNDLSLFPAFERCRTEIKGFEDWLHDMRENPLELDFIEISTIHYAPKPISNNKFLQLSFSLGTFISPFFKYEKNRQTPESDLLKIAVQGDNKSVGLISRLAENKGLSDTEFPGITAKAAEGTLHELIMSGNEPDLFLFAPSSEILEAANLGFICDLTQFSTYHALINERFSESSMQAYKIGEKIYGLPLTDSVHVMFYRSDIFSELELTPPKTWADYSIVSETLRQNGMETHKNEDLNLMNCRAKDFISGRAPLIIADYTKFRSSLCELNGVIDKNYAAAQIPGDMSSSGEVIRKTSGYTTLGGVISERAKSQASAFKFLEWFTDDRAQTDYCVSLERMAGPMRRVVTANQNSAKLLPFKGEELRIFLSAKQNALLSDYLSGGNFE
ncbi:MAG: extracellular solute-binding protein [Eubacterium sp.]|jgi:hypothetical protein|nr:extracellular solute-binding protein [Eubacterium sp.]